MTEMPTLPMIHLENKKNKLDIQLKIFFLNATSKERDMPNTVTTILQNLKSARYELTEKVQ